MLISLSCAFENTPTNCSRAFGTGYGITPLTPCGGEFLFHVVLPAGGFQKLVNQVVAGLVGKTPHMISASVCALSRLVYEFTSQLEASLAQMMEVVLMLLRSKSREVVASVLGFAKVCVTSVGSRSLCLLS